MYKKYYQHFLKANPGVQHYAAHSHHYWPDITREAMLQYWDDSAKFVDDKWDYFFTQKIPKAQSLIAQILNLTYPNQIVFAPNTHEFIFRIISCLEPKKNLKILTTDSEFHSFDRQVNRLAETTQFIVTKIPTQPFADFETRFAEEISHNDYDLIFLSHVFFNSGIVVQNLEKIVRSVKNPQTLIVIDGYHAFMAVPTNLKSMEDRIFYVAGSYKYAQGGEGCCFMSVPKNSQARPEYTGWFAGFNDLSTATSEKVSYSKDGLRFAGSTMDYSALYRLTAVLELFEKEKLTVDTIHKHIQKLQKNFRQQLLQQNNPHLSEDHILVNDFNNHGHFFAFELADNNLVKKLHDELKANKIRTDFRGTRLRFGFGLYQEDNILFT